MSVTAFCLVIFGAALLQSAVGFGSAMVAMALLTPALGLGVTAPLVALVAGTLEAVMLLHHPAALDWRAIRKLGLGMLAGVPLGIWVLSGVPSGLLLPVLGTVIILYALYGLCRWTLPELHRGAWAYGAGFLAGLLGGAYNTSGPPVILYGNCRRWSPAEFRKNLQALFIIVDAIVIVGHAAAGNLSVVVWRHYAVALPAVFVAVLLGFFIARRIQPETFRTVTLLILLALGVRLCVV